MYYFDWFIRFIHLLEFLVGFNLQLRCICYIDLIFIEKNYDFR